MQLSGMKAKCPRGWSYPIGVQILASELSGVQHFDDISLRFWWSTDIARVLAPDSAAILRMVFESLSPGLSGSNADIDRGYYEPRWDLWIYAVPSTLKSQVRKMLRDDALPSLRRWLDTSRSETWLHGRHWWSAGLHEGNMYIRDDAA